MNEPVNWGWIAAGVAIVWNVINSLYAWYAAGQSVTKKEIDKLMSDTGTHSNRLTAIERDMKALPSAENYHKLELMVTEVRGALETMKAEMRPTAISVKRIEDFLLNSNKPAGRR